MMKLFKEEKYQFLHTLAHDVVAQQVSEQFMSLDFDSKPITFNEAPEDVVLVVMSDFLTTCDIPTTTYNSTSLLKGSVVIKLSEKSRLSFLGDNYGIPTEQTGLMYSDVSYILDYSLDRTYEVDAIHNYIGKYDKDKTVGLVVPLSDVLSNNLHMFFTEHINMAKFLNQFSIADKIAT